MVTRETLTAELPEILREYVEAGSAPGAGHGRGLLGGAGWTRKPSSRIWTRRNQELLRRLAPESTLKPEVEGDLNVVNLLKVALKNEIEATESAARWLATTAEIDVKLALARQVGDEAKHYRLIADRLRELGFDAHGFDPLAKGYGPLFQYLDGLRTTVERVAAGQFTREAIAVVKNRQFIEFCEAAGRRGDGAALPRRHRAGRAPSPRARAAAPAPLRDDARDAGGGAPRRHADARAGRGAAGRGPADRGDPPRPRLLTDVERGRCEDDKTRVEGPGCSPS